MEKIVKPFNWLLIAAMFSLNIQGAIAQENINQPAAESSAAEQTPQGTAITSRRDATTSIPPVQTAVTRDASKSEVAINWENVTEGEQCSA